MVMMQLFSLTRFIRPYTHTHILDAANEKHNSEANEWNCSRMNGKEVRHFGVLSKRVTQMPFSVDQIQLI